MSTTMIEHAGKTLAPSVFAMAAIIREPVNKAIYWHKDVDPAKFHCISWGVSSFHMPWHRPFRVKSSNSADDNHHCSRGDLALHSKTLNLPQIQLHNFVICTYSVHNSYWCLLRIPLSLVKGYKDSLSHHNAGHHPFTIMWPTGRINCRQILDNKVVCRMVGNLHTT